MRELRGAVLAAVLGADPPKTMAALRDRVSTAPASGKPGAVERALTSLQSDGLIGVGHAPAGRRTG